MSKHIQELIDSRTTVVFPFGLPGAGKTTFLATLFTYLFNNYMIELNLKYNKEGISYFNHLIETFESGKLPSITSLGDINEIDLAITTSNSNEKRFFTFLDLSGESFNSLSLAPNQKELIDDTVSSYLESEELSKVVLCFFDCSNPKNQDFIFLSFLSYLSSLNEFGNTQIGVILTKWDTVEKYNMDIEKYLANHSPQLFHWLMNFKVNKGKSIGIFPFTIGNIMASNEGGFLILKDKNDTYCQSIIDWLLEQNSSKKDRRNSLIDRIIKFLK